MEIRVERLCKAYHGIPVLENVTFTAGEGVTCLMGPSGEGKTTLLRILLGLERADSGRVCQPPGCRWAAVFQENRLLEHLDAMGNLRFVLGGAFDRKRARRMLDALGLEDAEGKCVRDFSGGMRRRLALARALLAPFDALALDEPFTGLDGENRSRAMDCIRRAAAQGPVLLVSHDAADAAGLEGTVFRL